MTEYTEDYRKYIIRQRALHLKERIEKAREREETNPYHAMYA